VLAEIAEIDIKNLKPCNELGFRIEASDPTVGGFALVPPDVATCCDCLNDCIQPGNRRYLYPFTNCTNCGPRYTIIQDIPYDRRTTTMAPFRMCPGCQAEYDDPGDRRFHAQPNACAVCGPRISAPITDVREWLREGAIVAIKGLGGYHLACDAAHDSAVRRLRQRKRRGDKPFAIMARSLEDAERFCEVNEPERALLTSARRPIVLLRRRGEAGLSTAIAPGNRNLGVMLPYTPLHHLLFLDASFTALVMTSGNLSEEPIVSREEELPRLASLADRFLTHDRPIQTRVDDSVARVFRGRPLLVRRSRGFAPAPIDLGMAVREVVAVGGELKNTFCLTKDHYAILSQHIGDLENYETLEFFRETLTHMKRFFRVQPEAVAHDLHPGYLSTRAALEMEGLPRIGVQHHHAHAASCMAEHHLAGKVIGVAFDGTGYGSDGAIWGGEVLVCDYAAFERRYHLRYVPLAGGDAAVREPWRVALAYLRDCDLRATDAPALAAVPEKRLTAVETMLARSVQTVNTSSCGRLFDAVSALLGLCLESRYEAQAAIELEAAALDDARAFAFDLGEDEIDLRECTREIVSGLHAGKPVALLAARFHQTVADAIIAACASVRAREGLTRVCLSGGSFQNMRLLEATIPGLERAGMAVFWQSQVPSNDGGLALGQAVVANAAFR
jgi:hydrogenase maturation protein HypF